MLKFFLDRKNIKYAIILYERVLRKLGAEFRFLNSVDEHWTVGSIHFTKDNSITYLHEHPESGYTSDNNHKCQRILGIEIYSKTEYKFKPLPVFLNGNFIQDISLCFNTDISKEFDFNRIVIRNLRSEEVETKNPDFETVSAILKDIPDSCMVLLDIKSSFEIEIQNKKYYTIVDMEDGNYIATNTECYIFRFLHDHEQPIKLIFEDIEEFCKIYIGKKENLNLYFE